MSKWKEAFLKSLDPGYESEADFRFGAPVTDDELEELESQISAKVPDDLRSLLREFNGIKSVGDYEEAVFFAAQEMPEAAEETYREWDWPTELLMECSRDILYVCQENGEAEMWGMAIRPFGSFQYGQVVAFDHDRIMDADEPDRLFVSPYPQLLDLVEAKYKKSS